MARPRKNTVTDPGFLEAALEGLELQKARIESQIQEVRRMLGKTGAARSVKPEAAPAPRRKRELSPAARKRIAAAQKRRWAEYRKKGPAEA